MTDANGNTTRYCLLTRLYDLLSTTYANGTSSTYTYDPEGDATVFLEPPTDSRLTLPTTPQDKP